MIYKLNGKKLKVGKQNLSKGTVDVTCDGEVITCQMFSDEDGDIGFYYGDEEIYFSHLEYEY